MTADRCGAFDAAGHRRCTKTEPHEGLHVWTDFTRETPVVFFGDDGAVVPTPAALALEGGAMPPERVTVAPEPTSPGTAPKTKAAAKATGYTGDACSNCGGLRMFRSGTCATCSDCGTTSGCS